MGGEGLPGQPGPTGRFGAIGHPGPSGEDGKAGPPGAAGVEVCDKDPVYDVIQLWECICNEFFLHLVKYLDIS